MSVQIAQHHVRIGHRRTIITQCITCRPGSGARRFGSDAQQSARIDPRQRTSPGPDFGNIYRRHLQYVTASFYEPAWSADAVSELVLRSEEHTSELQSLMRNSYALFSLKKKLTRTKLLHKNY